MEHFGQGRGFLSALKGLSTKRRGKKDSHNDWPKSHIMAERAENQCSDTYLKWFDILISADVKRS